MTQLGDGAHVPCKILAQLMLERVPDMHHAWHVGGWHVSQPAGNTKGPVGGEQGEAGMLAWRERMICIWEGTAWMDGGRG